MAFFVSNVATEKIISLIRIHGMENAHYAQWMKWLLQEISMVIKLEPNSAQNALREHDRITQKNNVALVQPLMWSTASVWYDV